MTTFAIFYNMADLTPLVALVQGELDFTPAERTLARRLWQNGLNQWANPANLVDPLLPENVTCCGDTDCRRVVISNAQVSKQQMIDMCRSVGNRVQGAGFFIAIANDMETSCIEPWPPA